MKSSINTMPLPSDKTIIPLGFESNFGGSQTLSLDSFYLDNHLDIWLFDKLTKSRINLIKSSYFFNHSPENPSDRFVLFLGPDLTEEEITLSNDPLIFIKNESIVISGYEVSQRIEVSVYNLLGQTVCTKTSIGTEIMTIPIDRIKASGAVIVSFKSGKTVVRKKVILPY